jgi:hypothetical protein
VYETVLNVNDLFISGTTKFFKKNVLTV